MAIDSNEIVAAPSAMAVEEITPVAPVEEAPAEAEAEIPDEVLQIPAFQALLEGRPAAVYEVVGQPKIPGMEAISKNIKKIADAGINLYKSADDTMAVLFNTQFLSLDDIKKADKEGKLTEIAEPVGAVVGAYDSVLGEQAAPGPSASPPPQSPNAPINKRLTTARLQNLSPGEPTSGPAPGGGRVLNNVLKRAV